MANVRLSPESGHELEGLLEPLHSLVEFDAEVDKLALSVPQANTDNEAPLADHVKSRQLLSRDHRMVERQQDDGRHQLGLR